MDVQKIDIDAWKARDLWREYKKHQHWSKPEDDAIRIAYQKIVQGKMVIQAFESVKVAGVGEDGWPKLALARADMKECFCRIDTDGRVNFMRSEWRYYNDRSVNIQLPPGSLPSLPQTQHKVVRAILPIIPIHIRPKRALENYHILWEAEWRRVVPKDPLLLRRIGKGDLWLVLAHWELTEVERAALAHRVTAQ